MTDDFASPAAQVQKLLRARTTAFLLVTSAQREPIDEAIWFRRTSSRASSRSPAWSSTASTTTCSATPSPSMWGALARRLDPDLASGRRQLPRLPRTGPPRRRQHRPARRRLDGPPLLLVPQLDDDVHDVQGLLRMHRYLFAARAEREALIEQVVA